MRILSKVCYKFKPVVNIVLLCFKYTEKWALGFLSTPLGLSQDNKESDGYGHHQEKARERVLLERQRMYARLQYNVYQLLHLQQGEQWKVNTSRC